MRSHSTWLSAPRAGARGVADVAWSGAASRGQGLVEYALIILLVALVVFVAVTLLGPTISSIFLHVNSAL